MIYQLNFVISCGLSTSNKDDDDDHDAPWTTCACSLHQHRFQNIVFTNLLTGERTGIENITPPASLAGEGIKTNKPVMINL